MTWRRLTLRSIVVAVVVALVAPAMWFIITGETSRTPTIAKSESDRMTDAQRKAWIDENAKPVSLWEHVMGTPGWMAKNWLDYLEVSGVVFLVVLVINSAFLTGAKREP
jgi:hypothetical protein